MIVLLINTTVDKIIGGILKKALKKKKKGIKLC